MLSFPPSLKIFLSVEPCDMRKGFNGLHALVSERLGEDVRVFRNDAITARELDARDPAHIVISPGPGGGSARMGIPTSSSARRPGVGWAGCSSIKAARTRTSWAARPTSRRRALLCAPPVEKLLVMSQIPWPLRCRLATAIARG